MTDLNRAIPPLREAALPPCGLSHCASQAKPTAAIAKGETRWAS
jgi:hypothetical protein